MFVDVERLKILNILNVDRIILKTCGRCNGVGKVTCTECNGWEKVRCDRCNGSGRVTHDRDGERYEQTCSSCGKHESAVHIHVCATLGGFSKQMVGGCYDFPPVIMFVFCSVD